jgi:hypothetical protein
MSNATISRADVMAAIVAAVEEVNAGLAADRQIATAGATALFGNDSGVDSFTLVNVVIGAEQQILDRLDQVISLASEQAMSRRNSPFRSIDTLTDYAVELIQGVADGT